MTVDLDCQLSAEGWPEPEWRSASGAPLEPAGIVLPSGAEMTFHVRIPQIAVGRGRGLHRHPERRGRGDTRRPGRPEFVVGQAAPQPDPTITTLAFNNAQPAGAVNGGIVTVTSGSPVTVQLRVEFTGPSSAHPGPQHVYNLSVVVEPNTGWTAALASGPIFGTPPSYSITGPATRFPAFTITRANNAVLPAVVTFALVRAGVHFISTISFQLASP